MMWHLVANRVTDWDSGTWEYILFRDDGVTLNRFEATPDVASDYCREYGVKPASPMDYYRMVVCRE